MIPRAPLHLERRLVQRKDALLSGHRDIAKKPVFEQLRLITGEIHYFPIEVGVIFLLELMEVIQFGFVEPLEYGPMFGAVCPVAGKLVEVERIEFELNGVAD